MCACPTGPLRLHATCSMKSTRIKHAVVRSLPQLEDISKTLDYSYFKSTSPTTQKINMSWRSLDSTPELSHPVLAVPYRVPSSEGFASRAMSPLSASASQLSFSSPVSRSSRSPSGNIRLPGLLGQSSVVASPVESVRSIASFFTKLRSPPRHSEFYLQDELSVFLVSSPNLYISEFSH